MTVRTDASVLVQEHSNVNPSVSNMKRSYKRVLVSNVATKPVPMAVVPTSSAPHHHS